jgi:hypothetical protein
MVKYDVPGTTHVSLKVYNVLGQEVATLIDALQPAGRYRVEWNASKVASGVYYCRMQAGEFIQTNRLVVLR